MAKTNIGKVRPTPRGAYISSVEYKKLDIVTNNGSSYIALRDNVGVSLNNEEYWLCIAEKGVDGKDGTNGTDGKDATINGVATIEIRGGQNVTVKQEGSTLIIDYDDSKIKADIKTIQDSYITKAVEDLENYYKKSETYTQEEINQRISSIPKFAIEVVDELPTKDISSITIYLLKTGEEEQNLYTEYIYTERWEKLGTQTVDLTNYVKNMDVPTSEKSGPIKTANGLFVDSKAVVYANIMDYTTYKNVGKYFFISKGTLENVITGKELVNKTYVDEIVGNINTALAEILGEEEETNE